MDLLANHDATGLADLVRRKDVTPLELVDAAIARIERVNPRLNAVVTPLFERARDAARGPLPDGPFTGVPFLLKDLVATLAGVRMTSGSLFLRDFVPKVDSELVTRLKRAGFVIVGKTNTPELGLPPTTEPVLLGATRNPWDVERTPGGSSGGAAAAVASGMVPLAHGGDGGGSIRIPASCCGLFGLKPTRARNPLGPVIGDIMSGFVVEHAISRSVRDSAALLDATSGPDIGDPYWAPPPARPFLEEVGADPGRLRIAFTSRTPTGTTLEADAVAAVEDAARLCGSLGHEVVEDTFDFPPAELTQAFMVVWAAGAAAALAGFEHHLGRQATASEVEPGTWALCEMGRHQPAERYLLAIGYLQQLSRRFARFFERYDLWLTPTTAEVPPPLGTFDATAEDPLAGLWRSAQFVPFTPVANFTGQPAMSVPLYWTPQGLPLGAHFVARFGDEATLFRLAAQLEKARPWAGKRPPVSA